MIVGMDTGRSIALLDCNNFFVSCERLFRPDLRRKPVLVLSSNDGCVVARSQEVKDLGIPMGVPLFQIKDLVKAHSIATFSSNFTLYRDISRRVMEVLEREVAKLEPYSIDEAFFEITGSPEVVEAEARRLKGLIEAEVGVPVSIGIAPTKTQAKCANLIAKRGAGVYRINAAAWSGLVPTIMMGSIWGVGRRLSVRYSAEGIATVADFLNRPLRFIEARFGVVGARLWHELNGTVAYPVGHTERLPESTISSRSFGQAINDLPTLKDAVFFHLDQTAGDVRRQGLAANTIKVYLQTARHGAYAWQGGGAEERLSVPSNDLAHLMVIADRLTDTIYRAGIPYTKAGVLLSGLCRADRSFQLRLLPDSGPAASVNIMGVYDAIKTRFGDQSVGIGRLPNVPARWQSKRAQLSPSYTTSWQQLPIIKA